MTARPTSRTESPADSLASYRRNVYSQNGEDGVIAEILRRLRITSGTFCEFGAWDGRYGSNSYSLLLGGWRGLMIEGDPTRYRALLRTARSFGTRLRTVNAWIDSTPGASSLDSHLQRAEMPREFELLSIDVDGIDYWIWQSLVSFQPLIVVIEIDSSAEPGIEHVHDEKRTMTTFSPMLMLGKSKGYELVCHTGNMIFVRRDRIQELRLPEVELEHPASLFDPSWVNPTSWSTWRRKLRNLTWQRALVKVINALRRA